MERYRIVLADDHVLFRQGLGQIIKSADEFEVVGEAGDGVELLSLLDRVAAQMVIVDISMPKLSGIEAIAELKARHPGVKVLVLSMHKEYLYRAISAGADGYLLKEDADQDLFHAIGELRRGQRYVTLRLAGGLGKRSTASERLSRREKDVLSLIAQGKPNKAIAESLFISIRTVESHRASIMAKVGVSNTAELVRFAIQEGFL